VRTLLALAFSLASPTPAPVEVRPARLVPDFVAALGAYGSGTGSHVHRAGVQQWLDALTAHGVDPDFIARRLAKAQNLAAHRDVRIEHLPPVAPRLTEAEPVALHAYKFDVDEEYDDASNDDVYCYFVTTHDDKVWGKATSIYRGMDEGTSFFFLPEDRGLFGPKGDKLTPVNHTIVDYGIIESDGDDIAQLKKVSDVIVDLAVKALDVYDPEAGAAAEAARAEVQNLLHLVIEMDDDDHLVTDSLYFTPDSMQRMLGPATFTEISRRYDKDTAFTHFTYRLHFRLMR
jgi:hypothetical protein